jgi:hypothetical protein
MSWFDLQHGDSQTATGFGSRRSPAVVSPVNNKAPRDMRLPYLLYVTGLKVTVGFAASVDDNEQKFSHAVRIAYLLN